jgi:hypothetical protein
MLHWGWNRIKEITSSTKANKTRQHTQQQLFPNTFLLASSSWDTSGRCKCTALKLNPSENIITASGWKSQINPKSRMSHSPIAAHANVGALQNRQGFDTLLEKSTITHIRMQQPWARGRVLCECELYVCRFLYAAVMLRRAARLLIGGVCMFLSVNELLINHQWGCHCWIFYTARRFKYIKARASVYFYMKCAAAAPQQPAASLFCYVPSRGWRALTLTATLLYRHRFFLVF